MQYINLKATEIYLIIIKNNDTNYELTVKASKQKSLEYQDSILMGSLLTKTRAR